MKEKKKVYCEKCSMEVTSNNDLVVTNNFLSLVAYHEKCFSKELKGVSTVFVGNSPINGTMGNISAIMAVIIGVVLLFVKEFRYISAVMFLGVGIRFYSWFIYERHLQ